MWVQSLGQEDPQGGSLRKRHSIALQGQQGYRGRIPVSPGAESAQAPSVFKQAKDKVSVSKIPLSLFFI